MFAIDWPFAADVATVGELVLTSTLVIGSIYAAWHTIPRLFNHGRVMYERNFYRDEVRMLKEMLDPMRNAADLLSTIDSRLAEMERVQIVSIRYIADLLVFIQMKDPTEPIPPLPPELRDEVLEALQQRQQHRADANQGSAQPPGL